MVFTRLLSAFELSRYWCRDNECRLYYTPTILMLFLFDAVSLVDRLDFWSLEMLAVVRYLATLISWKLITFHQSCLGKWRYVEGCVFSSVIFGKIDVSRVLNCNLFFLCHIVSANYYFKCSICIGSTSALLHTYLPFNPVCFTMLFSMPLFCFFCPLLFCLLLWALWF